MCTAVIGGFPSDANELECAKWLSSEIGEISGRKCSKCPFRKSKFKGILFVTFDDSSSRDYVVDCIRSNKPSFKQCSIWASQDVPLPVRVEKKCLLKVKRLFIEWGWQSFELYVDVEKRQLLVDHFPILTVSAHGQ